MGILNVQAVAKTVVCSVQTDSKAPVLQIAPTQLTEQKYSWCLHRPFSPVLDSFMSA